VDVVLANQKNQYFNIQNVPTGISDCHNIISVTIKGDVPVQKRKIITYRSYKNFDTDSFNCDLEKISFPDIENFIGNKTYVFCIWLLLIHCSYTEVDFYRVVYFDIHYIHCVLH
jgi:hypothetical protein